MTERNLSPPVRFIIVGAAIVIILAGIRAATPILGPLLLAVFLAMITTPLLRWLVRHGVPPLAALGVILTGLIAGFLLVSAFVGAALVQIVNALPTYQEQLNIQLALLELFLADYGVEPASIQIFDLIDRGMLIQQLAAFAGSFGGALFDAILIVIATGFLLLEASHFTADIERRFGTDSRMLERIRQSSRLLIDYMIVRTKVNLITGAGVAALLYVLGVDFALLWGLLTFILSYIPYIGLALAALPATVLAWLELGLPGVVIVLVGVTIVNALAENVLFPQMAGQGLDLSPFVVLFSVVFWGFILGGAGVFLAVPLTLAVKMVLEVWEETRWLAALMSSGNSKERASQN
ncbi:AI-2E family transporter [Methanoculleus sp. FWC-SCC1]|uniref:AI-2E family transporter n=1 Tax=Methanoculleus frigidifontis TaxID=2584085 RepID=A0ABT8MAH9_9EURY|nr:AI-2E family transporter [Methanoculleus sp. FWC-SCC1]MDN7024942.1 AI-2E family transporter [Methanoculleus sp. FWC-SCC1]